MAVALLLLGCLLAGPLWIPVAIAIEENYLGDLVGSDLAGPQGVVKTISLFGATVGLWWMMLAPLAALGQRTVRWLLLPVANGFQKRHAWWLGIAGLALVTACVLAYLVA